MEQILKTIQEIHANALEQGVHVFGITTYRWDSQPDLRKVIALHVVKEEGGEAFNSYIHEGDDDEARATISQLKIYLGL